MANNISCRFDRCGVLFVGEKRRLLRRERKISGRYQKRRGQELLRTLSKQKSREKRKYNRYDTEVEIYFRVNYDIKTLVKFQLYDTRERLLSTRKYSALSRNVSAQGLCFCSSKKLQRGNFLHLEIYLPKRRNPILMFGQVRWSRVVPSPQKKAQKFVTGIKLIMVDDIRVQDTIHSDKKHRVIWSVVLESILGNFRMFAQKIRKTRTVAKN